MKSTTIIVVKDSRTTHPRRSDDAFLTRSTATWRETVEWEDGSTYPLIRVDVTAFSHPFWTGNTRVLDAAGQVEKFNRRYGARKAR